MSPRLLLAVGAFFFSVGCAPTIADVGAKSGSVDASSDGLDGGDGGSGDGGSGDDGGSGSSGFDFEPAAVGVEVNAGWDSDYGLLRFIYSSDETGTVNNQRVEITVTDIEWFSMDSDDPERRFHKCTMNAVFPHIVHEGFVSGYMFDYDSGHGGTGESVNLDFFAEGRADIYSYDAMLDDDGELITDDFGEAQASETCQWMIDEGMMDKFNGMHVGFGYGDLSDYMYTNYWDEFGGDLAEYEDSVVGSYVAINHPTDEGGVDFRAYDWSSAVHWSGTSELTTLTDSEGTEFDEQVVIVDVDPDGFLMLGDPSDAGYRSMSTYWYEDFPNLDLDILKEGIPSELDAE